ncbi:MAG TPA: peroxiredoxin [Chthoniobacteraceae bacterium]|jgi:peroxiredoxin Q/BCP|nr:peroxiredoxin [Chthoniobacteraceae bacterium]
MRLLQTLTAVVTLLATSVLVTAAEEAKEPLAVGAAAPKITAIDQDGKTIDFAEYYKKGTTLVYFYPKANTGGCTKQACGLRDNWSKLKEAGIQVIGVSEDPKELQKDFETKNQLPFKLAADTDGKVAQAFGVPLMGKVTKRQSFLIKDGKVVWNMLDKTSTDKHAEDVLKANAETPKKG